MGASTNGHQFGETHGDREGQGDLVCCSSWGPKKPDTAEQLDNKEVVTYTHAGMPICTRVFYVYLKILNEYILVCPLLISLVLL